MKNVALAMLVSLALHGIVAAGLAFWFDHAPTGDLPKLDLSSVDVVLSETSVETAPSETPRDAVAAEEPSPAAPPPLPVPSLLGAMPPDDVERLDPKAPVPAECRVPSPQVPAPPIAPSTPSEPDRARVDGLPEPLQTIVPDYPRASRKRGDEGTVMLEIGVDEQGIVRTVHVVSTSGHELLDRAAVRAARAARFRPAREDGKPVPGVVCLPLSFTLKR